MAGDAASDGHDIEALCSRLLNFPHPEGPTRVDLFVRQLPESVAADIPIPPNWRVVGSALHMRRGRPARMEAVIDAPGSFAELMEPFERALGANGWKVLEPIGVMHGGFVSSELGESRAFRRGEQGPVLSARGISRGGGPSDVRLTLDWDARPYRSRPHMRPDGAERLPALSAPANTHLRGQSASGGSGHWTSESTIETGLSVGETTAHFAEQLVRAGWNQVGGSVDDTVGWSSWQLPGDGNWRGLLLVLAAFHPGEQSLILRVEKPEPEDEEWASHTISSHPAY